MGGLINMKHGLLLVNLGSPASPETSDVKEYLKEFLSDQNVIEMPKSIWQPILRGMILPTRSWRSATFYKHIWSKSGSPLIVYTQIIRDQVRELLPDWDVEMAMTYGTPKIVDTLKAMEDNGCDETIVIPLFPQYTQSTHKTIIDKAKSANVPIKIIEHFYENVEYQKILAQHIQKSVDEFEYDQLLFSYHGIPTAMINHGDPYQKQCEETTSAISKLITFPNEKIKTVYQSKFGPMPWLKPYLKNELSQLVAVGKRNVLIVTPSFVADCLETLEEDNVQNYQSFKASGGDRFKLVEPMNDDPRFSQFIANLAFEAK